MGIESGIQALNDAGIFAFVVPFLLAVAITFGLLDHLKMPKNATARGVISILVGLLVLPLGGTLFPFLEGITLGMMAIVAVVLALLVMAEASGIAAGGKEHVWITHPKLTGVVFIIIAVIVFVTAGGLEFIGLQNVRLGGGLTLAAFLIIMALGVWWISGAGKKE